MCSQILEGSIAKYWMTALTSIGWQSCQLLDGMCCQILEGNIVKYWMAALSNNGWHVLSNIGWLFCQLLDGSLVKKIKLYYLSDSIVFCCHSASLHSPGDLL